jgi:acylphosphatase
MGDEELIALHAHFAGIVQGVYFRMNTQRQARKLGLKGWVRNLHDGRVEAWIEGERSAIGELLEFCQTSIPGAQVDMVDMEETEISGDYPTFEIVR